MACKTPDSWTDSRSKWVHPFSSAGQLPFSTSAHSHLSGDGHARVSHPLGTPWGFQIEIPLKYWIKYIKHPRAEQTHLCSPHFTQSSLGDSNQLVWISSWGFSLYGIDIHSGYFSRHQTDKKKAPSLGCAHPLPISVLTLHGKLPG